MAEAQQGPAGANGPLLVMVEDVEEQEVIHDDQQAQHVGLFAHLPANPFWEVDAAWYLPSQCPAEPYGLRVKVLNCVSVMNACLARTAVVPEAHMNVDLQPLLICINAVPRLINSRGICCSWECSLVPNAQRPYIACASGAATVRPVQNVLNGLVVFNASVKCVTRGATARFWADVPIWAYLVTLSMRACNKVGHVNGQSWLEPHQFRHLPGLQALNNLDPILF